MLNKNSSADDPQKYNAPKEFGGKFGLSVDGNIFETKSRKRFNEGFMDCGSLMVASTGPTPNSVKVETNERGCGGTIFSPSHCGGDLYKLSVYVDPEWLKKKKSGQQHLASVETGTFVVWRNIRINRYLQLRNGSTAGLSDKLEVTLASGKHEGGNPEQDKMYLQTDVINLSLLPGGATKDGGYAAVDASKVTQAPMMYRPIPVDAKPFDEQLNWAYCELINDSPGIELLAPEERKLAEALGIKALKKSWTFPKRVNWESLIYADDTSPFLCNLLSLSEYNQSVSGPDPNMYPALDAKNEGEMTAFEKSLQWFYEAMMEHYAGGGVLPGITIVQIPRGDTWDLRACDVKTTITSGYGTGARGFYISHTAGVYHNVFHIYPATSNAIHEIGHVLGLAHQPPAGADILAAHQDPVLEAFSRPSKDQCVCVMSYSGCYGDLCGKCLMSLRGWAQTHENKLYEQNQGKEAPKE